MSLIVASLYLLCLAFLFGSALYVYSRDPFSRLNASYALLALSLLGWVGTLFLFDAQTGRSALLWLGRANFAAAAIAAPAALSFVFALARRPLPNAVWVWLVTAVWAALSLLTGLIDKNETVRFGIHLTTYGPLFVLYALHVIGFMVASAVIALRPAKTLPKLIRTQMRLVGVGIVLTALVSVVTNAVLPYLYSNYRYIDAGTLATIFFLAAISYETVALKLFDLHLLIKQTVIFTVLIAFALELYQLAVGLLAQLLPLGDPSERHIAAAGVAFTINAFTHEPLRQWLEQLADRLWSGRPARKREKGLHHRTY